MFKNSSILITGGTGSFGNMFVPMTLKKYKPRRLIVFSRDEMKQWEMQKIFSNDKSIRFFIGDVRDKDRLYRALHGVDFVVHAAATKIVPTAEADPFECIKTNINGAMNLIDACIDQKVKKVVALSTDKASAPSNLYGASKLVSDKLFIAANSYSASQNTRFSIVRYGNVMGSRGSVIPLFIEQLKKNKFTITNKSMTRFMITLEQGVDLVWKVFRDMNGGEIYVKKIPSMNITDIAKAISSKTKIKTIGIRPGEKIHEQMISIDDAPFTYEYKDYYKIFPSINLWSKKLNKINKGKKVSKKFNYRSDTNKKWMQIEELKKWISKNKKIIGKI